MRSEQVPLLSPFTKRELRTYSILAAVLLSLILFYNILTIAPPLSPTHTFLYALLSILLILEYGYTFGLSTHAFPQSLRHAAMMVLLEGVLVAGIVLILGRRATPYLFLLAFDGYTLAIYTRRGVALSLVVALLGVIGVLYGIAGSGQEGWHILQANLFWVAMAILSAEIFVRQWQQRERVERLLGELEQAHQQLREYAHQAEELAVTRERARLAHELHDTMGHILTAINVQLELLLRLSPQQAEQRRQTLLQTRALTKEGLADVRRAVRALRPLALEVFSLPEAIARLIADFERTTQISVASEFRGELANLPSSLAMPLYRAVQESLTNVQRHAPEASHVQLRIACTSSEVSLSVENDGVASPPASTAESDKERYGLRGLHERAEALGGIFRAGAVTGGNFRVEMILPLDSPLP